MPAYVIVEIETADPAAMARYRELASAAVAAHGGTYLARGGRTLTFEGGWAPERLVVLEFASLDAAQAWWASAEYAQAREIRERAGRTRMVAIEGA